MHRYLLLIRTIALGAFLAMPVSALAVSPETDSAADFISSNPMYLPRANHIYGETSFSYASGNFNDVFLSGAALGARKSHISTVQQVVGFGVTDEFTVRLIGDYVSQEVTINSASTGMETSLDSSGFDNPTLDGTWRAIDQRMGAPVSVDATFAYSPNWMTSKIASVDENGTIGSGRQEAAARLAVGRVSQRFSVSGQVQAHYLGTRHSEDFNNRTTAEGDPYWNYTLSVLAQVPLTPTVALNGGYMHTIAQTQTTVRQSSGITAQSVGGDTSDFTLAMNYKFINTRLVGQIGYDNIQHDRMTTTYAIATSDFYTARRSVNQFSAHLLYAF